MIFPTMSVLIFGAIAAAILLAADWYVWGMTYANNFRYPVRPRGTGEMIAGKPSISAEDEGHGFKKVA